MSNGITGGEMGTESNVEWGRNLAKAGDAIELSLSKTKTAKSAGETCWPDFSLKA